MKLQPVSLLVALTFIIAVPAQASEVVIQDKNRINSAQVNNKPDIEDYDTLNYIGLDKARQQLSVYQNKSKVVYDKYIYKKNISYGLGPREKFDHFHNPDFSHKDTRGVFIFIHGGYWQGEVKEAYAFIGEQLLEKNIDVMLIEYDLTKENMVDGKLTPRVSMTALVNQVGRALDTIQTYMKDNNMSEMPVYLSGHSAGGHLAAYWKDHPAINSAVLSISGLFDLSPIATTKKIGTALQLSENEIVNLSPINNIHPANKTSLPIYIYYGGDEQPELKEQSLNYSNKLQRYNYNISLTEVDNANHLEILASLFTKPDSDFFSHINKNS
ncbi:alpha/beta hydrolase [Salmonella enterica]|nr:alpha/beta hydrolase [Salmonella enterica]EBL9827236.1 alpha/beta hydrolase [Salmonella enterica]ECO9908561.1 alpha/beta hydrolase [Salmonella enterica]EDS3252676.1 alpha/beta hydrolase [Salmonella enterica]EHO0905861.1 alpha/beta hydrolase [Salmonella enterica]